MKTGPRPPATTVICHRRASQVMPGEKRGWCERTRTRRQTLPRRTQVCRPGSDRPRPPNRTSARCVSSRARPKSARPGHDHQLPLRPLVMRVVFPLVAAWRAIGQELAAEQTTRWRSESHHAMASPRRGRWRWRRRARRDRRKFCRAIGRAAEQHDDAAARVERALRRAGGRIRCARGPAAVGHRRRHHRGRVAVVADAVEVRIDLTGQWRRGTDVDRQRHAVAIRSREDRGGRWRAGRRDSRRHSRFPR